jgi:hypothetical protein
MRSRTARDFPGIVTVGASQHPHDLNHRDNVDESRSLNSQSLFDDLGSSPRLRRVALRERADHDVAIKSDHRRAPADRKPSQPLR